MIQGIAACAFSISLSARMMFAQCEIDMVGSPTSTSVKNQSSHKCAQVEFVERVAKESPASAWALLQTDACSDPIDKCKDPVKYLGANGECACFACEAGRRT